MIKDYLKIIIINLTILGNQQLYSFKSSKIFNKLFNNISYSNPTIIYLLAIYKYIKDLLKLFLLNFTLIAVLLYLPLLFQEINNTIIYTGLIFIIPLIAILSIRTFKANEKKFNIVHLMRYDAKRYCFSEIIKYLISTTIIFIPTLILILLLSEVKISITSSIIYYTISYLFYNLLFLYIYDKKNVVFIDTKIYYVLLIILLLTPLGLSILSINISYLIYKITIIIKLILSILLLIWYHNTNSIYKLYKERFSSYLNIVDDDQIISRRLENQMKIDSSIKIDNKYKKDKGYKYFNDIFVIRHKDILKGSTKIFSYVLLVVFLVVLLSIKFVPITKEYIGKFIENRFFYVLYIMILSNQGMKIIRAMFFHCDRAMLKYNFYRNKKTIFNLYKIRILSLIKINLPITIILTIGLDTILLLTTKYNTTNLILLTLATIVACNFFSIYFVSLYYLIQPFTNNMKDRNVKFNVIVLITYMSLYEISNYIVIKLVYSTLLTIIGCITLSIIFYICVKLFSSKTFKLRNE